MLLFIFTGQQYVLLQLRCIYIFVLKCIFFSNKCWGRGLWAWSDFPSFLSLADHMPVLRKPALYCSWYFSKLLKLLKMYSP